jgi:hypothetical protein
VGGRAGYGRQWSHGAPETNRLPSPSNHVLHTFSTPRPERATLNAIAPTSPESAEERIGRHQRMCRRMADLGMALAEAAARRALKALSAEEHPASRTGPDRGPDRGPDPSMSFSRAAASVRQAIKAEAGLGAAPRQPRRDTARPSPEPRPAPPERAPRQAPVAAVRDRPAKPAEDPPFPLPTPAAADVTLPAAVPAGSPQARSHQARSPQARSPQARSLGPIPHPPPLPPVPNPPAPVWPPPPQPKAAYPPRPRRLDLGSLFER